MHLFPNEVKRPLPCRHQTRYVTAISQKCILWQLLSHIKTHHVQCWLLGFTSFPHEYTCLPASLQTRERLPTWRLPLVLPARPDWMQRFASVPDDKPALQRPAVGNNTCQEWPNVEAMAPATVPASPVASLTLLPMPTLPRGSCPVAAATQGCLRWVLLCHLMLQPDCLITTSDTGMMLKKLPPPLTLPRPLDMALLPKPTRPSVPLAA